MVPTTHGGQVDMIASRAEHLFAFATLVECVFGLWAYVAAWLLWRRHIQT
jgi:hypothetical protein